MFARVREEAVIPSKRPEDAGFDLYACFEDPYIRFEPLETRLVPTGIASAFSASYYIQIQERGSTGVKGMATRAGVIDSGYRGEWLLPITNLNHVPLYIVKAGTVDQLPQGEERVVHPYEKAFCQGIFLPVPETAVREVPLEVLQAVASERGAGHLGSSGK